MNVTRRRESAKSGFLSGDTALAAIVLWASGHFDTLDIATVLGVREDAVYRTLHLARSGAIADYAQQMNERKSHAGSSP